MSTTRRGALGAALATPLLGRLTGTASADAAPNNLGTISDGWVEVRWVQKTQAELDRVGAVVEAVTPARLAADSQGPVLRFPLVSGTGDPSLADLPKANGSAVMDGAIVVRSTHGAVTTTVRFAGLRGDLRDQLASWKCTVNGVDVGHDGALKCDLASGVLTTDGARPGQPTKVRLTGVPVRPTPELLALYTATFGAPPFTADTVMAYATAEAVYTPPAA